MPLCKSVSVVSLLSFCVGSCPLEVGEGIELSYSPSESDAGEATVCRLQICVRKSEMDALAIKRITISAGAMRERLGGGWRENLIRSRHMHRRSKDLLDAAHVEHSVHIIQITNVGRLPCYRIINFIFKDRKMCNHLPIPMSPV